MSSGDTRERRRRDVRTRASLKNPVYPTCRVLGCGKPTRAGTGDGLDRRLCRVHADLIQRHGSLSNVGYPAKVLNPYRRAALAWLKQNGDRRWVKNALLRVQGLYTRGGPHVEAFRLRGLTAQERAKAHWARLRQAEIDPALVVAAWLAIEMAVADDPQADKKPLYKRVQAAKLVHRMASGSHKRWASGSRVESLHAYPRSRGRVLVHIGEQLEEATDILVAEALPALRDFKREMDRKGRFSDRPYPKGTAGRRRTKA